MVAATPRTPEPLLLPFFTTGLFVNRSPLYNALAPIGVNVISRHDALIDGVNIEVTDRLTLQRRPGFVKYCNQQLGAGEFVNEFYSVRNLAGTVTPLVDTNVALYTMTPTALTSLLAKTTKNQAFVQQVGNITYISDGVDFVKWDGSTSTPWGIAAPTFIPQLSNTLTNPGYWIPKNPYTAGFAILDVNGNIEYCTQTGISGATLPVWNPVVGGTATDNTVIWENVGPPATWIASMAYTKPSVIVDTNNNLQLVTTAGTSNSTVPSWNATLGATTTDNTVTWTNIGPGNGIAFAGYSYVHAFRTVHGNLSTASPISQNTGPMLSSASLAPVNITSYSISSNVLTIKAINTFSVGQGVTLAGFPVSTFLNGQTVTVLASGLSGTQFKANFTNANVASTPETGIGDPVITTVTGRGSANPECNSICTVTAVSVTSNIVTFISANNFTPDLNIYFSGFTNAVFLNGQILQVLTATPTQFTALLNQPDVILVSDAGSATFLSVEVYRPADGGGIFYFDGAALNPGSAPIASFDSGLVLAGAGADNGVPGTNPWTNPNNVTSPSSFATSAFNPPVSGIGTFNVVQVGTGLGHYGYNSSRDTYTNGPANIGATLVNAITAGNCLLCVVMVDNSTETISSISDNQGNTYVLINSENGMFVYMVYAPAAAGPTNVNVTVTPDDSEVVTIVFAELNGLNSGTNLDVTAKAAGTASPFNTGSVVTTNAPDVIISAAYQEIVGGNVQPAGYTILGSRSFSGSDGGRFQLQVAYIGEATTGTFSPNWSNSTLSATQGITISLKSTSTAGTDGLNATTFPLSVPAGVTPLGIKVEVDAKYNGGAGLGTIYAQLLKNGNPYGSVKTLTPTSSNVTYPLGGSSDLWGAAWNPGDFPATTNWGVQFSATQVPQAGGPFTFSIKNANSEVFGETGITQWTFNDIATDAELDTELVAPLAHLNDPPPGQTGSTSSQGGTIIAYWMGRIWMAVGNLLYFSGGPDILNGISEECFPPANVFTFPGNINGLAATTGGLVVMTSAEWWAILGGPQTVTFYPERILGNFGILSPNALHQDGDNLYVYTTQKQAFLLSGANKEEVGWNVGPLLSKGQATASATATAWSPGSTYVTMHRNGEDSGIYFSNGVESMLRFSLNANNWSPIYQPLLTGSPSLGAIRSVETSSGIFSLLAASHASGDFIYARSLTTFSDNGNAYPAHAIIGNIVVTQPGQPMVPLYFVNLIGMNVGSVPSVSFMPNEIGTTNGAAFTPLPTVQNDPVFLAGSKTLMAKRYPANMNQLGTPLRVKHLQVSVDFGAMDTVQNELLTLGLRFDQEQMG